MNGIKDAFTLNQRWTRLLFYPGTVILPEGLLPCPGLLSAPFPRLD
jgi:hypothetical protein